MNATTPPSRTATAAPAASAPQELNAATIRYIRRVKTASRVADGVALFTVGAITFSSVGLYLIPALVVGSALRLGLGHAIHNARALWNEYRPKPFVDEINRLRETGKVFHDHVTPPKQHPHGGGPPQERYRDDEEDLSDVVMA